ncbi:MAG: hypothetical protein ACK5Z2_13785 [Bacteroidota bacterium]|jgi:hypothetical protein
MKQLLFAPILLSLPFTLLFFVFPATYLLLRSAYEDYAAGRIVKRMRVVHASV